MQRCSHRQTYLKHHVEYIVRIDTPKNPVINARLYAPDAALRWHFDPM